VVDQIVDFIMEFFDGWSHISIDAISLVIVNTCHVLLELVLESVHHSAFNISELDIKSVGPLFHLI